MRSENGGWEPGIGDNSLVGWMTVVAYFATAWLCYRCYRITRPPGGPRGPWQLATWWSGLTAILALLGVNKQLDLQTLVTHLGRQAARAQGWYGERRAVQALFIAAILLLAVVVTLATLLVLRRWLRQLGDGVVGLGLLLAFVTVRAASFHHVDRLLGLEVLGLRFNWIMELGALALIARSALRVAGWPRPPIRGGRGQANRRTGREEVPIRIEVRPPPSE